MGEVVFRHALCFVKGLSVCVCGDLSLPLSRALSSLHVNKNKAQRECHHHMPLTIRPIAIAARMSVIRGGLSHGISPQVTSTPPAIIAWLM